MDLTFKDIVSVLPQDISIHINNADATLLKVNSFSEGCDVATNVLYFDNGFKCNNIKNDFPGNFIVYTDSAQKVQDLKSRFINSNIVVFKDKSSFDEFESEVREMFNHDQTMNNLSNELLRMIQEGSSVEQIVELAFKYFGNPILLVDVSFMVLANAGIVNENEEPRWNYAIHNRVMPSDYIMEIVKDQKIYDNISYSSKPVILWRTADNTNSFYNQLSGRIIMNGEIIGYLKVLEYNRNTRLIERLVLEMFCRFLSIVLSNRINTRQFNFTMVDNLLVSLITEQITDKDTIQNLQIISGMKLFDILYTITIVFDTAINNSELIYYLKRRVQNHLNRSTVVVYNSSLVVLYDTQEDIDSFKTNIIENLEEELKNEEVMIYGSLPFNKLYDFSKHYQQTLYCQEINSIMNQSRKSMMYHDVLEKHMIVAFDKITNIDNLLLSDIKKLLYIDQERGSDLLATLFCYVSNKQDITTTAEAMFVHYNTMKYRIDRIKELISMDLECPRIAFLVMLSEQILALRGYCTKPKCQTKNIQK